MEAPQMGTLVSEMSAPMSSRSGQMSEWSWEMLKLEKLKFIKTKQNIVLAPYNLSSERLTQTQAWGLEALSLVGHSHDPRHN